MMSGVLFLIILGILLSGGFFWFIGVVAYKINAVKASHGKCFFVGFIASLLSTILGVVLEEYLSAGAYRELGFLLIIIMPFVLAYLLVNLFDSDNEIDTQHEPKLDKEKRTTQTKQTIQQKKEVKMSSIHLKNLVRIPVWALYSLIVATVAMSFVMLIKIWFPETVDEALIWKIILSYAVFLISALVISNLTDKIKLMRVFQEEE